MLLNKNKSDIYIELCVKIIREDENADHLNLYMDSHRTVLYIAIGKKILEICHALLDKGADPNKGLDPNFQEFGDEITPLGKAKRILLSIKKKALVSIEEIKKCESIVILLSLEILDFR